MFNIPTAVYLCCTGLGVTSTRRYLASCPVKPGLSSPALRSRDRLSYLHIKNYICIPSKKQDYICDDISKKTFLRSPFIDYSANNCYNYRKFFINKKQKHTTQEVSL